MITLIVLLLFQQAPSLSELISASESNWPQFQQTEFHHQISTLNNENIRAGKLPSLSLNLDASYQSDVTEINLGMPGINPPSQLKERLALSLQANQLIYDGGVLNKKQELESLQASYQSKQVEVGLVAVRQTVSSLFFTVLKLQKKMESLELYEKDIDAKMNDLASKVKNGVVPNTSLLVMRAEQIKLLQSIEETSQDRMKVLASLSILSGMELSENLLLLPPELGLVKEEIARPELEVFSIGYKQLDAKKELTTSVSKPKVSSFLQAAYGRPGLDIFEDSFTPYYIVGLKASWNFWDWNATQREREVTQVQKKILSTQEQLFRQRLQTELTSAQKESEKWISLVELDDQIISVKQQIVDQYQSRLTNGTITPNEYLSELNAFYQAVLTKEIHLINHLEAKATLHLQKGARL